MLLPNEHDGAVSNRVHVHVTVPVSPHCSWQNLCHVCCCGTLLLWHCSTVTVNGIGLPYYGEALPMERWAAVVLTSIWPPGGVMVHVSSRPPLTVHPPSHHTQFLPPFSQACCVGHLQDLAQLLGEPAEHCMIHHGGEHVSRARSGTSSTYRTC